MLYLHFINVGDGDAVLVEEREGREVFRLLVDAGRPDVGVYPGSRRLTAAAYLARRGVSHLNALVVTHLHTDHFGGLSPLLEQTGVDTVYSGFFPRPPVGSIARTGTEEKTVRGLMDCLEQWAALTNRLTDCREVEDTRSLALTPRLRVELIVPDPAAAARQRRVWTALLSGEEPDRNMVWWSSKYRNPGSLRVRLYYAGRRVELAGDCYGAAWEDQAERCDLLKVPHHGDAKSVTPLLLDRLRPLHAVVSCSAAYNARKDRPSLPALALLEARGARVWFTDGFVRPGCAPDLWPSVNFLIQPDGTILSPDGLNHSSLLERESAGRSI